jgi:hypothetical protein
VVLSFNLDASQETEEAATHWKFPHTLCHGPAAGFFHGSVANRKEGKNRVVANCKAEPALDLAGRAARNKLEETDVCSTRLR